MPASRRKGHWIAGGLRPPAGGRVYGGNRVAARWFLAGVLAVSTASAQEDSSDHFESKIRPLLVNKCAACHSESLRTSGLSVASRESLLQGGQSGPAIIPGSPEKSVLVQALRHTHSRLKMPPQGKLADQEIEDFALWVRNGAHWPEARPVETSASAGSTLSAEDRSFWSFAPLRKFSAGSSVDAFVERKLRALGLERNPPVDRRTLIRRASFDLIGLPPTPAQVATFEGDGSPAAFSRVVEQLLASPHFGERWGRYWLDIARFGEDDYTGTEPKYYPNAWRYRDWVVRALNDDMPYDLFVKSQLAGDLLPGDNERYLGGLGFLGLGPWYYSIAQPPQARADERHDRIDVVTRGFLGLTAACARCHDHKYDPITMRDYYGLAGVFASTQYKEYPLAPPDEVERFKQHEKRVKELETELQEFRGQQSEQLSQILARQTADYLSAAAQVLQKGNNEAAGAADIEQLAASCDLDRQTLEQWVKYLAKNDEDHPYLKEWRASLSAGGSASAMRRAARDFQRLAVETARQKQDLDKENAEIVARSKPPKFQGRKTILPFDYVSEEDFNPGAEIKTKSLGRDRYVLWSELFEPKKGLLWYGGEEVDRFLEGQWKRHLDGLRADLEKLKEQSPPAYAYLQGVGEHQEPIDLNINVRGNPTELGDLIPRGFLGVLSNREQKRFGPGSGRLQLAEAILAHPLAARVIANRVWERLFGEGIVRTPSNFGKTGDTPSDPELLDYLAGRLVDSGWSLKSLIRDIVLSATYRASSESSGPGVKKDPENRYFWRANRRRLDMEAMRDSILFVSGRLDNKLGGDSHPLDADFAGRTVYVRVGRFRQNETMALFDFPSASVSSEKRAVTNVPLQRLFFLNSEFIHRQARELAGRVCQEPDVDARIARVYRLLFNRLPEEREVRWAKDFLQAGSDRWWEYAQVLLSSNEFLFVD